MSLKKFISKVKIQSILFIILLKTCPVFGDSTSLIDKFLNSGLEVRISSFRYGVKNNFLLSFIKHGILGFSFGERPQLRCESLDFFEINHQTSGRFFKLIDPRENDREILSVEHPNSMLKLFYEVGNQATTNSLLSKFIGFRLAPPTNQQTDISGLSVTDFFLIKTKLHSRDYGYFGSKNSQVWDISAVREEDQIILRVREGLPNGILIRRSYDPDDSITSTNSDYVEHQSVGYGRTFKEALQRALNIQLSPN